ncbi:MAG: hypothetical protein Q8P67_28255, partial [archaeon]|nr:hypothetical protein [archaeon]
PKSMKTIKPVAIGGRAGGDKYIVHGILFKFAIDSTDLFGGDDGAAAKVAGQERKGLMAYHAVQRFARTPLLALVDYRGFRLIAMSLLPIGSDTLIYGTADAGHTVLASDPFFNRAMADAGKKLNLAPHLCGSAQLDGKPVTLFSAADVEGHCGRDGRYYLLDFSRTLPCVPPSPHHLNGHLHRLFRKEFVATFPKPLCPDACSGFVAHDPRRVDYNQDIKAAIGQLHTVNVPAFVRFLQQEVDSSFLAFKQLSHLRLSELMHLNGLNMRYIGWVCAGLTSATTSSTPASASFLSSSLSSSSSPSPLLVSSSTPSSLASSAPLPSSAALVFQQRLSKLLMLEALARALKNVIRRQLRQTMRELRLPLEVPYHQVVISLINSCFFKDDRTEALMSDLLLAFDHDFNFSLTDDLHSAASLKKLINSDFVVDQEVRIPHRCLVLDRLLDLTGMRFFAESLDRFRDSLMPVPASSQQSGFSSSSEAQQPFSLMDFEELGSRVKHTGLVPISKGRYFQFSGIQADLVDGFSAAASSLLKAVGHYEEALSSMPDNADASFHLATTLFKLMEIHVKRRPDFTPKVWFDTLNPPFLPLPTELSRKADHFFQRAMRFCEQNSQILASYAQFQARMGRASEADSLFVNALTVDPRNAFIIVEYGQFLVSHGIPDGELFLQTAAAQSAAQAGTRQDSTLSPITGSELEAVVPVFLDETSFTFLRVMQSTPVSQVLKSLIDNLTQSQLRLYLASPEGGAAAGTSSAPESQEAKVAAAIREMFANRTLVEEDFADHSRIRILGEQDRINAQLISAAAAESGLAGFAVNPLTFCFATHPTLEPRLHSLWKAAGWRLVLQPVTSPHPTTATELFSSFRTATHLQIRILNMTLETPFSVSCAAAVLDATLQSAISFALDSFIKQVRTTGNAPSLKIPLRNRESRSIDKAQWIAGHLYIQYQLVVQLYIILSHQCRGHLVDNVGPGPKLIQMLSQLLTGHNNHGESYIQVVCTEASNLFAGNGSAPLPVIPPKQHDDPRTSTSLKPESMPASAARLIKAFLDFLGHAHASAEHRTTLLHHNLHRNYLLLTHYIVCFANEHRMHPVVDAALASTVASIVAAKVDSKALSTSSATSASPASSMSSLSSLQPAGMLNTLLLNGLRSIIKDRYWGLKVHRNVICGCELVAWLRSSGSVYSANDAVEVGRRLVDAGLMHHVYDKHHFKNEFLFYRLREDEKKGASAA